jgi:hypothetical protein
MADEPVFLYIAAYDREVDARADYEVLQELHAGGVVGTYDAAIVTKDGEGRVHVHKREKPTQHGAWTGIGEAALVVVGRSKLEETLDRELKRANKRIEKQVDADAKAFEKELDAAANG